MENDLQRRAGDLARSMYGELEKHIEAEPGITPVEALLAAAMVSGNCVILAAKACASCDDCLDHLLMQFDVWHAECVAAALRTAGRRPGHPRVCPCGNNT